MECSLWAETWQNPQFHLKSDLFFFLPDFGRILDPGQCSTYVCSTSPSPSDTVFFFNSSYYQGNWTSPSLCLQWCLTYMYILGYHGCFWLRVVVAIVWEWHLECSALRSHHCCWSSDGCFLVFRVSMRDWTPRFTLLVTRRVTESGDGGEEEPARWEGGRATRHFWYRSWGRRTQG